jgi:inosine/xanthosine triphosphatase
MNTWSIAVGSTRKPKVNAVKDAALAIATRFDAALEVVGYEVESGVGHTPASRGELMQGARQRAEALRGKLQTENSPAQFYVGLEGGLDVVVENGAKRVFLESWAYVTDGNRGHFGSSGSIELPEALAEEVLSRGRELAMAIDQYAGAVGIRDGQGAWGILSGGLISRQESFRLAVITALAPFYNTQMYRAVSAAGA